MGVKNIPPVNHSTFLTVLYTLVVVFIYQYVNVQFFLGTIVGGLGLVFLASAGIASLLICVFVSLKEKNDKIDENVRQFFISKIWLPMMKSFIFGNDKPPNVVNPDVNDIIKNFVIRKPQFPKPEEEKKDETPSSEHRKEVRPVPLPKEKKDETPIPEPECGKEVLSVPLPEEKKDETSIPELEKKEDKPSSSCEKYHPGEQAKEVHVIEVEKSEVPPVIPVLMVPKSNIGDVFKLIEQQNKQS